MKKYIITLTVAFGFCGTMNAMNAGPEATEFEVFLCRRSEFQDAVRRASGHAATKYEVRQLTRAAQQCTKTLQEAAGWLKKTEELYDAIDRDIAEIYTLLQSASLTQTTTEQRK